MRVWAEEKKKRTRNSSVLWGYYKLEEKLGREKSGPNHSFYQTKGRETGVGDGEMKFSQSNEKRGKETDLSGDALNQRNSRMWGGGKKRALLAH